MKKVVKSIVRELSDDRIKDKIEKALHNLQNNEEITNEEWIDYVIEVQEIFEKILKKYEFKETDRYADDGNEIVIYENKDYYVRVKVNVWFCSECKHKYGVDVSYTTQEDNEEYIFEWKG